MDFIPPLCVEFFYFPCCDPYIYAWYRSLTFYRTPVLVFPLDLVLIHPPPLSCIIHILYGMRHINDNKKLLQLYLCVNVISESMIDVHTYEYFEYDLSPCPWTGLSDKDCETSSTAMQFEFYVAFKLIINQ